MESREVLLVNPNRMRPPIAPVGLEYLAAALDRAGHGIRWCDLTFAEDWRTELRSALAGGPYQAAAVSVRNVDDAYFASQDFILERTTRIVREIAKQGSTPTILGGVGFSLAPREVLEFTGADFGIAGEGEAALPLLLDCLNAGDDVSKVPGAVYRDGDGKVQCNAPTYFDLSKTPTPPRRWADNGRYLDEGGQLGIETKRGCVNKCVYCVEPFAQGRKLRLRTPESVVEEVRDLLDQGVNVLHVCDSEFNLPVAHARAVCNALEKSGLGSQIWWYAYAYPQPFDVDLAHAMSRAGCAGVDFGVDHCNETMLQRLGRKYKKTAIRKTAQACRDAGLTVMFDLLLGAPGETRQTLTEAIDFMRDMPVDRIGLSCGVRIYPNTALAEQIRAEGPIESNPCLHGHTDDNPDFLKPIFYVSKDIGGDIHDIVSEMVEGDRRFLHANPREIEGNYNYNDNSVLANAIREGERGAYWDILRRLDERSNLYEGH